MRKLILIASLVVATIGVKAQSDLVLYNFNAIPQTLHVNPAYPQQTKLWIGLPVLSGVKVNFHNSGFRLVDLLATNSEGNNLQNIAANLNSNSHFAIQEDLELLGIGWRTKNGFLSFGAIQKGDVKMDYPADLIRFLAPRDGSTQTGFKLDDFSLEGVSRINFYIGYQRRVNDKLTLGGRAKYVVGQQHIWTERSGAEIDASDPFELKVKTDFLVRTAGNSNFLDGTADLSQDAIKVALPNNRGYAFDLGAHYKFNDKWSASASLLDVGYIKWRTNTRDYISRGDFSFEGIEVDFADQNSTDSAFSNALDSIQKAFEVDTLDGSVYDRALNKRVFLGVNYNFNKKHAIGLLYHVKFWDSEVYHDYSINYQGRWSRGLQFIASYSVINGTYNNVGAGVDFKVGPVQLYIMSYNVLGAILYDNLQSTNIRVGLNLTFYGKKGDSVKDILEDPLAEPIDAPFEPEGEGEDDK